MDLEKTNKKTYCSYFFYFKLFECHCFSRCHQWHKESKTILFQNCSQVIPVSQILSDEAPSLCLFIVFVIL